MKDYALVKFFIKSGKTLHEAVELASKYWYRFSYEVTEVKST